MNTTFFQKASENKRSISWGDIFSDVWKKHRKDQRTALLTKGMGSHIPAPNRMLSDWQKPWLFARVLIAGLVLSVLIGISCVIFPGYGMLLMLCLLPAFVVPLSVMLFYWEMNIPGNISTFTIVLNILELQKCIPQYNFCSSIILFLFPLLLTFIQQMFSLSFLFMTHVFLLEL